MSAFDAPYEPSPWEPISEEVARYESSAGTEPSALVGESWMILWTIGARSGSVRKTPLVRIADGAGRYAVIGSQGGAPTNPNWVHNLRANPKVRIEVGTETYDATARELPDDERDATYPKVAELAPVFAEYQANTTRAIPLFELVRA